MKLIDKDSEDINNHGQSSSPLKTKSSYNSNNNNNYKINTNGKKQSFSQEALAGFCYCIASISMVLMNKLVLSSFNVHVPNTLLFLQCFVSVLSITSLLLNSI